MADYKSFSHDDALKTVKGRYSVITVEQGPVAFIPEAINIDLYVDGEKQKGKEQIFETSDINDNILKANLEDTVYISEDAIGLYDEMKECAQMFREANGNLDIYAAKLEEKMRERSSFNCDDEDDPCYNDGFYAEDSEYDNEA